MAARWGGYTFEQFEQLEGDRQAFIVAAYRCSNQIEGVLMNESMKQSRHSRAGKYGR